MKYNVDLIPSKSVHWATPSVLYNEYMIKGFIDPCPLNCTKDNLKIDYYGYGGIDKFKFIYLSHYENV